MRLGAFSVDTIKGYTRATCVAFIALAVSELDVNEESEKIKPLMKVLDRAWLVPMHVPWLQLNVGSRPNEMMVCSHWCWN